MPDQNRTEAFNEAVAVAKARHQQALSEASRAFNAKHTETKHKHRDAHLAASEAWDAVKSTPEAEGYEEMRQAFINAKKSQITRTHGPNWTALSKLLTPLSTKWLRGWLAERSAGEPAEALGHLGTSLGITGLARAEARVFGRSLVAHVIV